MKAAGRCNGIRSCRGASAVEFALILIPLFLILFGVIEFGLLLFNKQVLTNASREGARYGINNVVPRYTDTQITSVVTTYTGSNLVTFGTETAPVVNVTRTGVLKEDDLTVQVTYRYNFLLLPNFATSLIGGIDLNAATTMKYE